LLLRGGKVARVFHQVCEAWVRGDVFYRISGCEQFLERGDGKLAMTKRRVNLGRLHLNVAIIRCERERSLDQRLRLLAAVGL
jgi:hypothetical protein